MKKLRIPLLLLFSILLLTVSLNGTYASNSIKVTIDGASVQWTDAEPFIDDNYRTMVPLRAVGEALGLNVDWDNSAKEAIFTKSSETIYFPIDSMYYRTENGTIESMDTAAVIVKNRTYAPVRYLAEYFGYNVSWDGSTQTVVIIRATESVYVLVDTSYYVADDTDNEYYNISRSCQGIIDGKVRFKQSGGYYQDDKNYFKSDVYYECQQPPSALSPGQEITLQMSITVENYEHASSNGTKPGVHANSCWIQDSGSHFIDKNDSNNTYLTVPVPGDIYVEGEFVKTVGTSSKYEIKETLI